MSWDIRNSRVVPWLGVVGATIAIVQVIIKVWGSTGFLDSLNSPIPLWVLLATAILLSPLTLLAAKRTIQPTENRIEKSGEPKPIASENQVRDCMDERAALQVKLDAYESLENEIIGFLVCGLEVSMSDLKQLLSVSEKRNGFQVLLLAIASLEQKGKIIGTGSTLPRIKLAPKRSS